MILHFLDSSAFVKLFIWEEGAPELRLVMSQVPDSRKNLSVLATLEVRSSLQRRLRIHQLSSVAHASALDNLQGATDRFSLIAIEYAVIELASELISRNTLRSLDAIQLATALLLKEELEANDTLLFIASDHKLLASAAAEGLTTWDPADLSQPLVL